MKSLINGINQNNNSYGTNYIVNQSLKINKIIDIEKLNKDLEKSGKTFAEYFIREIPEQIMVLLHIIKENIHDPRRMSGNYKHNIIPILGIIFLSILAGYDIVRSIYNFGIDIWSTLISILEIDEKYPSYDTFRRVLNAVNPKDFVEIRRKWHRAIGITYEINYLEPYDENYNENDEYIQDWIFKANEDLAAFKLDQYVPPVRVCAQDGKLLKATKSAVHKEVAKDIISIYDVKTQEVLAESVVPNKKNEISENINVVNKLDANYKYLISYDAMGCQRDLAEEIDEKGWYYLFKVKDNQPKLKRTIEESFDKYGGTEIATRESSEGGHYTMWTYYICNHTNNISNEWAGAKSFGMVVTYSERDGETTEELSYFIMNFLDPILFLYAKIKHWRIENGLHHPLDCVFNEDHCRVRTGYGHQNLNIVRKAAITFYRYALRYIYDKNFSLKSLIMMLRKSIFCIEKCIENVKNKLKFSYKELVDNIINL